MLAIARALMTQPKLLLLDEPSMGLAPLMVAKIFEIVREIAQRGVTILLVEQNAQLALELASRGYVMESGAITLAGESAHAARRSARARSLPRRDRELAVGLRRRRALSDAQAAIAAKHFGISSSAKSHECGVFACAAEHAFYRTSRSASGSYRHVRAADRKAQAQCIAPAERARFAWQLLQCRCAATCRAPSNFDNECSSEERTSRQEKNEDGTSHPYGQSGGMGDAHEDQVRRAAGAGVCSRSSLPFSERNLLADRFPRSTRVIQACASVRPMPAARSPA